MKKIINTPIFYYPSHIFTGDNLTHFIPAKYLWLQCNVKKNEFIQPVYNFKFKDEIKIDFAFYPEHPFHLYFKKPYWINEFIVLKDLNEAIAVSKKYDFFVNNYRYRGAVPEQLNWGYSKDVNTIELYLSSYSYKALFEERLFIEELELQEKYDGYLKNIIKRVNPNNRPLICVHQRGDDLWDRHLPNVNFLYENLLANLISFYPNHLFILLGESWRNYKHPRVKLLQNYINQKQITEDLGEYTASLQYILALYFCRDVDLCFVGISGFSYNLASIRSSKLTPPIPVFWSSPCFSGKDYVIEKHKIILNWKCCEYDEYMKNYPHDNVFSIQGQNYIYYAHDEKKFKKYCSDFPNNLHKIFDLLMDLEKKYFSTTIIEKKLIKKSLDEKIIFFEELSSLQKFIEKINDQKFNFKRALNASIYFLKKILKDFK